MNLTKQNSSVTLSNSTDTTRRHTIHATVHISEDGTMTSIDGGSLTSATDFSHLANFSCGSGGSGLTVSTMGQELTAQQYMDLFSDILDFITAAREYIAVEAGTESEDEEPEDEDTGTESEDEPSEDTGAVRSLP